MPPPRPGRSRRRRSREPSACPSSGRVEEESRFSGSVNICDNIFHCRVFLLHSLCSWSRHTESPLHSSIIQGYHILSLIFSSKQTVTVFGTFLPLRTENTSGMDVTTQIVVNYCKLSIYSSGEGG